MLNLNLLRVFHEVAEKKSVAKAAATLFVSQPAVSNALKRLQQESGVYFFHKTGRTLTLTSHGIELFSLTTQMFTLESKIEKMFNEAKEHSRHSIRLGLATIYERFGVAEIKKYFSAFDDAIAISVHSGNSLALLKDLEEQNIDIAIVGDVLRHQKFSYQFYKQHHIYLVVPKGHRLYGKKEFSHADIRGERMVIKEKGSSVRKTVDAYIDTYAVHPAVIIELSNIDAIFNLVNLEKCLTFLPDLSITEQPDPGGMYSIARCTDIDLCFSTYIVRHVHGEYPDATREIITQFCASVAAGRADGT